MKQSVYAIFALAVIIFLTVYLTQREKMAGLNPAIFLPENVTAVIEQKLLMEKIEEFSASRLGKALHEIDYEQIAQDLGLPEEDSTLLKTLQIQATEIVNNPVFSELFSQQVVCGFLPIQIKTMDQLEEAFENSIIVITKPRHNAKVLEMMASFFTSNDQVSTIQYGNHTIHRFVIEQKRTVAVTRIEDVVLMAFSERSIRSCIDRYDNGARSLNDNEDYKRLKHNFSRHELFSYFSLDRIRDQIKQIILQEEIQEKEEILQGLATWNGWRAGAYGAQKQKDIIDEKFVFLFDKENLHPYVKEMIDTAPEKNTELGLASGDSLAYYWTNSFNIDSLINMYTIERGSDKSQIDILEKNVEKVAGVEFQSVISSIGNKVGLIVQEMNSEEFIPLPDFTVFLEIKNEKLIKAVMEKTLKHWGIPYQSKLHKDVEIYFWGLVPQAGMQPVVAFYKNYLFMASSVSMIKNVINTSMDGQGLTSRKDFKKVQDGLMKENNTIAYIQVGAIVEIIKEFVSWSGTMIAIQDRKTAHTSKILIDKLIHPILDGMKMYSVIGARSYIQGEMIINSVQTVIVE